MSKDDQVVITGEVRRFYEKGNQVLLKQYVIDKVMKVGLFGLNTFIIYKDIISKSLNIKEVKALLLLRTIHINS